MRRYGVERQRDAPLARIDRHRVHEIAGEQNDITGFGRRTDPLVCVVRAGRDARVVILEVKSVPPGDFMNTVRASAWVRVR